MRQREGKRRCGSAFPCVQLIGQRHFAALRMCDRLSVIWTVGNCRSSGLVMLISRFLWGNGVSMPWLNVVGLIFGMLGVVILFWWGPPQPSFEPSGARRLMPGTPLRNGLTVAQHARPQ